MHHRVERVNNLIKEELGYLLEREVEFPEALVTVMEVACSRKMERAAVHLSVLPVHKSEAMLKIAREHQARLQFLLLRKMNIRPMPRINFEIDRGADAAARIEKIFIEESKEGAS